MRNHDGNKLRQTIAGLFGALLMTTILVSNATSTTPVLGNETARHAIA